LTKALREVFREAMYLLCVKHLKDNATDYMRNKCGVQQMVRTRLIDRMFGDAGILNADDSVDFDRKADDWRLNVNASCQSWDSTSRVTFDQLSRSASSNRVSRISGCDDAGTTTRASH